MEMLKVGDLVGGQYEVLEAPKNHEPEGGVSSNPLGAVVVLVQWVMDGGVTQRIFPVGHRLPLAMAVVRDGAAVIWDG